MIIVEEEAESSDGKRKRYYKMIKSSKKQAEKVIREFITKLENKTFFQTLFIKLVSYFVIEIIFLLFLSAMHLLN